MSIVCFLLPYFLEIDFLAAPLTMPDTDSNNF